MDKLKMQITNLPSRERGENGRAFPKAWLLRESSSGILLLYIEILREKQFNKQVELNGELKRLRKGLEGLR